MGYGNLLLLLIYPDQWKLGKGGGGSEKGQQNVNKNMFVCRGIYFLTPKVIFRRASGQSLYGYYNTERFKVKWALARRVKEGWLNNIVKLHTIYINPKQVNYFVWEMWPMVTYVYIQNGSRWRRYGSKGFNTIDWTMLWNCI